MHRHTVTAHNCLTMSKDFKGNPKTGERFMPAMPEPGRHEKAAWNIAGGLIGTGASTVLGPYAGAALGGAVSEYGSAALRSMSGYDRERVVYDGAVRDGYKGPALGFEFSRRLQERGYE